ncbi:hypothetical protein JCM1840_000110 [Sporobolomyces johnsonii]
MASAAPPILSSSQHRLKDDPVTGKRSIHIRDWHIISTKLPILTIPQADAASAQLDLALPEICFGNNALELQHEPTGFKLEWNTLDMLRAVKKGEGWDEQPGSGAVRVAHADEWSRGQAATGSSSRLTVVKPYDWTYTTLDTGSVSSPSFSPSPSSSASSWTPAPPTHPGIPLALLARTDIPILFFDEVPLFEDELGDNGIAEVTVRVRVNATSLYILSRFSLRIDRVLFRHFDVRLYHAFGSSEIVREVKGREASYEAVKSRLRPARGAGGRGGAMPPAPAPVARQASSPSPSGSPSTPYPGVSIPARSPLAFASATSATSSPSSPSSSPFRTPPRSPFDDPISTAEDLTPLTDVNWVAGVLDELAFAEEMGRVELGAGEGGAGGKEGEWEGKGRRLEVMRVPWAAGGL